MLTLDKVTHWIPSANISCHLKLITLGFFNYFFENKEKDMHSVKDTIPIVVWLGSISMQSETELKKLLK